MKKLINIKGAIIPNAQKWVYDWFGIESVCPKDVQDVLDQCLDGDEIVLKVNSPGGNVYVASEIYDAIRCSPIKSEAHLIGMCASSATIVVNAVDIVKASPLSQYMMHKCMSNVSGNADDMLEAANILSKTDIAIANTYALKSGKTIDEVIQLMKDTTYMTPQEAIKQGFVDEMLYDDNKILTNIISTNVSNSSGLGLYNNSGMILSDSIIEDMIKNKSKLLNQRDVDFFNEKKKMQTLLNLLKLGGVNDD